MDVKATQEKTEMLAMKTLLLAMLVSAGFGPVVIAQIDNSQWSWEFVFSIAGGTLGVIIFLALPGEAFACGDITKMARVSLVNLASAVALGPVTCGAINRSMGIPVTPAMLVAVGCMWGFTGATMIQMAKPIWLKVWSVWNESKAKNLGGEE